MCLKEAEVGDVEERPGWVGGGQKKLANSYKYSDPSLEWNFHETVDSLCINKEFNDDSISSRGKKFWADATERLSTELNASWLNDNATKIVVLLLTELLEI